ncbi:hypothetical protein ACLKA6_010353 [Drosophila palustris]
MARQLSECLDAACDSSMPRRKPSRRGSPCYWWNDQIAQLRKACLRARRCSQRARRRPDFEDRLEDLRAAKRALKRAIKASKSSCFRQICEEADVNPWGTAYKVVTKTIRGQDSLRVTCPILLRSIVETLFPQHAEQDVSFASRLEPWQPISVDEVKSATKRIGDRKAPGPDGIPNKALKLAISTRPEFLTGHGGFRKYLHKYRHEDSPECPTCPSASEDPEHVLYYCTRYRGRAGVVPPPESLMAFMLATEDNWSSTSQLIIGIQRDLRRCERERRERSDA